MTHDPRFSLPGWASALSRGLSATLFASSIAAGGLTAAALAGCGGAAGEEEEDGSSGDELTSREGNARVRGTGGVGLRVRRATNRSSATIGTLREGAPIRVSCRARGEAIDGLDTWDYLPQFDGWVFDRYVELDAEVPSCGSSRGGAPTPPPPTPRPAVTAGTNDALGNAIVDEASRWLGTRATSNCQPFSSALGRPCEAWCADFIAYVWQTSGADIGMLTAWAGTFFDYGETHGTLKPRGATDVAPGDAVVWGRNTAQVAHAGIVAEVLENGDLRVIHGNWGSAVQEQVMPRSSVVGGYGIGGFVSPVLR